MCDVVFLNRLHKLHLVSGGQLGDQFGDVLLGPFGSGILGWFWSQEICHYIFIFDFED